MNYKSRVPRLQSGLKTAMAEEIQMVFAPIYTGGTKA